MERLEKLLRERCPELELRRDEPMSRHTSFRIGGPVPLMALPHTEVEVQEILSAAVLEAGVTPFFMGNGTNLLVDDEGADLFVVKAFRGLDRLELAEEGEWPGRRTIVAGSGVLLSQLANFAMEHGLTGLEFAHGIPGTVGGAVTMNAGAYGGEISQALSSVTSVSLPSEELIRERDFQFSYRHSIYQERREFILRASFTLEPGDPAVIKARMDELAAKRREKQPLEYPSAGSMFKRPPGHFAAALIDQCGLKGLTVGGAQVSEKHAGFVVNRGGATCSHVLELVRQVKERVLAETGVELEMEVKVLR